MNLLLRTKDLVPGCSGKLGIITELDLKNCPLPDLIQQATVLFVPRYLISFGGVDNGWLGGCHVAVAVSCTADTENDDLCVPVAGPMRC